MREKERECVWWGWREKERGRESGVVVGGGVGEGERVPA